MNTFLLTLLAAPLPVTCNEFGLIKAKILQNPKAFYNLANLNYRFIKIREV